jgi:hypothetical protein
MCSISESDEQNIWSLELLLFCRKYTASTKHLSVTDFFREKVTCIQVLMYLLLVYYFCRSKWKVCIIYVVFCAFNILLLSYNHRIPMLVLFP